MTASSVLPQHSFQLKYASIQGEMAQLGGHNSGVVSGMCVLEQVSEIRKCCHFDYVFFYI